MLNVNVGNAAIPAIGFGAYGMSTADVYRLIPAALGAGFRHIDTAQIYRNEGEIGECVAASGIPRSEIFLTTKVWVSNYSERLFEASVNESLRKLKTDYIDLLLLHWPGSDVPLAEQIAGLNAVARVGKVKHLGVSNFNRALMTEAIGLSGVACISMQFTGLATSNAGVGLRSGPI
jgi:2,5-diketo-D-gluconate reductase B